MTGHSDAVPHYLLYCSIIIYLDILELAHVNSWLLLLHTQRRLRLVFEEARKDDIIVDLQKNCINLQLYETFKQEVAPRFISQQTFRVELGVRHHLTWAPADMSYES